MVSLLWHACSKVGVPLVDPIYLHAMPAKVQGFKVPLLVQSHGDCLDHEDEDYLAKVVTLFYSTGAFK
jgi:hypothetical protein